MNKPAHHRQNLAHQPAWESKVNRNLSPSFARLQVQASQTQPSEAGTPVNEKNHPLESRQHANEPRPAAPTTRIHHTATDHTTSEKNTSPAPPLSTLARTTRPRNPGTNSTRITPWLIASITLTLALFSGNYAWHTQQDVKKLNLRLEQFEARATPRSAIGLPSSSNTIAKTEQALLALNEAQGQLAATITTLQSTLETNTVQTASRLTALEDTFTDLSLQMHEVTLIKEENKPSTVQMAETETANDETVNDSKTISAGDNSSIENWFINIASFSDPKAANTIYEEVHKITDKVSVRPISVNGQTLYRIRADGYNSREGAENEAQTLQSQLKLSGLWISLD